MELSITDNAGLAITYDYRLHQHIRKLAHRRASNTDYFEILSAINSDIRTAVTREFDAQSETARKTKEKEKAAKEKAGKEKEKEKAKGKGMQDRYYRTAEPDNEKEKETTKNKRWSKEDWAAWRKKLESGKAAVKSPSPDTEKNRKEKKK